MFFYLIKAIKKLTNNFRKDLVINELRSELDQKKREYDQIVFRKKKVGDVKTFESSTQTDDIPPEVRQNKESSYRHKETERIRSRSRDRSKHRHRHHSSVKDEGRKAYRNQTDRQADSDRRSDEHGHSKRCDERTSSGRSSHESNKSSKKYEKDESKKFTDSRRYNPRKRSRSPVSDRRRGSVKNGDKRQKLDEDKQRSSYKVGHGSKKDMDLRTTILKKQTSKSAENLKQLPPCVSDVAPIISSDSDVEVSGLSKLNDLLTEPIKNQKEKMVENVEENKPKPSPSPTEEANEVTEAGAPENKSHDKKFKELPLADLQMVPTADLEKPSETGELQKSIQNLSPPATANNTNSTTSALSDVKEDKQEARPESPSEISAVAVKEPVTTEEQQTIISPAKDLSKKEANIDEIVKSIQFAIAEIPNQSDDVKLESTLNETVGDSKTSPRKLPRIPLKTQKKTLKSTEVTETILPQLTIVPEPAIVSEPTIVQEPVITLHSTIVQEPTNQEPEENSPESCAKKEVHEESQTTQESARTSEIVNEVELPPLGLVQTDPLPGTTTTPSPNDSLDSSSASKENSLNHSQTSKAKRKSYQKEINDEGIVVVTITRASKKKKKPKT